MTIKRHDRNRLFVLVLCLAASSSALGQISIPGTGKIGDNQPSLVYNANTGEIAFDLPPDVQAVAAFVLSDNRLLSIDIFPFGGVCDGAIPGTVAGHVTFGREPFSSFSFGTATAPGLSESFVREEFGGSVSTVQNSLSELDLIYIPSDPVPRLRRIAMREDDQVHARYDADTGELGVQVPEPNQLSSVIVRSFSGILGDGIYDFERACRDCAFLQEAGGAASGAVSLDGFASFDVRGILQPGLSESFLLGDLSIQGTIRSGRTPRDRPERIEQTLSEVGLLYIPEPANITLLIIAGLTLLALRSRSTA